MGGPGASLTALGPRPAALVVADAEARALLAAIEDLQDELERAAREHEAVLASLAGRVEGRRPAAFAAAVRRLVDELLEDRARLGADAEELRRQLAVAEQRRAQRQERIARWDRQAAELRREATAAVPA